MNMPGAKDTEQLIKTLSETVLNSREIATQRNTLVKGILGQFSSLKPSIVTDANGDTKENLSVIGMNGVQYFSE
jgi:hypothetical protein